MTARDFWAARGAVLGGSGPSERVERLGEPAVEGRTAADGKATCVTPLLGVTPFRLTGSDRAAFLHGQLSNAVQGLAAGECNHTLQLDARGQVVGEATLCVREGDLLLVVEDGRGAAVRASLEAHIVFDDVRLEDLGGMLTALTVQGPGAERVVARAFGAVPEPGRFAPAAIGTNAPDAGSVPAFLFRRRRSVAGGVDVHLPVERLPQAVTALGTAGAEVVGEEALALMRVLAGVPCAAREGAGGGLPQEIGLTAAVSFGKGCYLGQEIMARIEARGAVRKGLARVRVRPMRAVGPASLEGCVIRSGGREAGRIGTVASLPDGALVALAVLRLGLPGDAALVVEDGAGRDVAEAEPWPLPDRPGTPREGVARAAGDADAPGGVQPGEPDERGL